MEGEKPYWVTRLRQGYGVAGMAIDRFTGEVIDKRIEIVNE
jgi:hypothetical protein